MTITFITERSVFRQPMEKASMAEKYSMVEKLSRVEDQMNRYSLKASGSCFQEPLEAYPLAADRRSHPSYLMVRQNDCCHSLAESGNHHWLDAERHPTQAECRRMVEELLV